MTRSTVVFGSVAFFSVIFLLCCAPVASQAAQKFPYTAQITESEAVVYSSPGADRYETQKLKAGDKVQVYQSNPDGWCAIRPPVGSFSWISGLYVQARLDNLGVVSVDQLSSRIGSQFGDTCKTVQVQLKKGERVILLERVETPSNTASPVWYKIVPPAGEFRWIRFDSISTASRTPKPAKNDNRIVQVSHEQPLDGPDLGPEEMPSTDPNGDLSRVLDGELPESESAFAELAGSDPLEAPNLNETDVELQKAVVEQALRPRSNPQPVRNVPQRTANPQPNSTPGTVSPQLLLNIQDQIVPGQGYGVDSSGAVVVSPDSGTIFNPAIYDPAASRSSRQAETMPTDPYHRAMTQLNRELHATLNRPTEDWMFDAMLQKGKLLVDRAPTEYDRTMATQMVQVLEKSRNIRKTNAFRREQASNFSGGKLTQSVLRNNSNQPAAPATLAANGSNPGMTSNSVGPVVSPAGYNVAPAIAPAAVGDSSSFKAKGRLGRFSQRPEGYPPYALVNEQGQIVTFLTPQPGVDLNPYINKQIGVDGTSGVYIKGNQRAPHVGVSTVFPVESI